MLTKEDLQAIGALIKESEERIRKDMLTKNDLEANNAMIGTILRVELAEIKQSQKHIEGTLNKAIVNHEERITRLEEAADITHRN